MKKITKLFSVLAVIAALFTLNSCEGLLPGIAPENNGNGGNGKSNGKTIEHEFYNSQNSGAYMYFTDTQTFTYTNSGVTGYDKTTVCIYQMSFNSTKSDNSAGTWSLYTRPKSSYDTIEMVGQGKFKGSPVKEGTVQLFDKDGTTLLQTLTVEKKVIQLEKTSPETYVFKADVTEAHNYIGATDAK